jgi:hypothetical protein
VLTLWVPTAQATWDLPGVVLDPNKPLTSHLNGEEGVQAACNVAVHRKCNLKTCQYEKTLHYLGLGGYGAHRSRRLQRGEVSWEEGMS